MYEFRERINRHCTDETNDVRVSNESENKENEMAPELSLATGNVGDEHDVVQNDIHINVEEEEDEKDEEGEEGESLLLCDVKNHVCGQLLSNLCGSMSIAV